MNLDKIQKTLVPPTKFGQVPKNLDGHKKILTRPEKSRQNRQSLPQKIDKTTIFFRYMCSPMDSNGLPGRFSVPVPT